MSLRNLSFKDLTVNPVKACLLKLVLAISSAQCRGTNRWGQECQLPHRALVGISAGTQQLLVLPCRGPLPASQHEAGLPTTPCLVLVVSCITLLPQTHTALFCLVQLPKTQVTDFAPSHCMVCFTGKWMWMLQLLRNTGLELAFVSAHLLAQNFRISIAVPFLPWFSNVCWISPAVGLHIIYLRICASFFKKIILKCSEALTKEGEI